MATDSVMPSNHLTHRCPLLFLPSLLPSIRVFSNESALLDGNKEVQKWCVRPQSCYEERKLSDSYSMATTGGTRNSSRWGGQGGPRGGGDSWAKCQMAAQAMTVPEHVGWTPWFASKVGQSASPTEPRKVGWRGRTSSTEPVLHRVSVSPSERCHCGPIVLSPYIFISFTLGFSQQM